MGGGISSILGAIALLGFLMFLAGIGLVVVSASQGRPVRSGILIALIGLVSGVLLSVISQGVIVVPPQEVAVVFQTISGELEEPRGAGTHIVIPVLQDATLYTIEQQEYTMSGLPSEGQVSGNDAVRGRTQDGQEIFMDITVLYRISPSQVNTLHVNLQQRYQDDFIRPTVRGIAREVVAGFTAEQVYGEARASMEQEIEDRITVLMEEQGMEVVDLLLRDITFSQDFTRSIEQAVVAQQEAERARRQVEQRQAEADQLVAKAEGERDAAIRRAEGNAEAIILEAQARAEALRLVSEQLAVNPLLIQYEYIQNLDEVNLALIPSNSPFLFDFNSIQDLPPAQADLEIPDVPETIEIVPEGTEEAPTGTGN